MVDIIRLTLFVIGERLPFARNAHQVVAGVRRNVCGTLALPVGELAHCLVCNLRLIGLLAIEVVLVAFVCKQRSRRILSKAPVFIGPNSYKTGLNTLISSYERLSVVWWDRCQMASGAHFTARHSRRRKSEVGLATDLNVLSA